MFSGFIPCWRIDFERQAIFIELGRSLHRDRSNAAPHELVDRCQQQLRIGREILRGVYATAGVRDRGDVAGAEVRLHELAGMLTHDGRPTRIDIHVVEHDDVHPAADRLAVRPDILGYRALYTRELRRNGQGNIYEGKRRNLLRLPIVEQLEIVDREADNQIALLVGDGSIDFDEVDLGLEG